MNVIGIKMYFWFVMINCNFKDIERCYVGFEIG